MRLAPLLLCCALLAGGATASRAAPGGPLSEIIVDVSEDQAPVRDVLRRLEERHGLNYAVSQECLERAGTVTVRFKQVPLDVALESICSAAGLHLEIRGPILVILPKSPTQGPALPRVEEGLPGRAPPQAPTPGRPLDAPPPVVVDDEMQAVGRVSEIDLQNRRLQLRVDGALRDFYLPDASGSMAFQASRLERAIATMEKGAMTALLYKRDGARSIVTALVGGTTPPPRPRRGQSPRRPRPPATSPDAPVEAPAVEAPAAEAPAVEAPPEDEPAAPARPRPDGPPLPEGALAGTFVSRDGDVVRVRLKGGEVVELHVPPPGTDDERRARLLAALDTVAPESPFLATYEVVEDRKLLRDTITEARRN